MSRKLNVVAITLGILLAGTAAPTVAQPIPVSGVILPEILEEPGKGPYFDFAQELAKRSGLQFKINLGPIARAAKTFNDGDALCLYPSITDNVTAKYVMTQSFNWVKFFVYTRPDTPAISDLSALKGKRVGTVIGYDYGGLVQKQGLTADAAQDEETNIKKLAAGRLDALIGARQDVELALKRLKMAPLNHDATKPVYQIDDAMLCADTPQGHAVVEKVNTAIKSMLAEGAVKPLLGDIYGEP
ncbi:MAG TPA: transporter substrate-binding domain-containing protein [Azospirillaceae bacterium]|nr:transporter substrate-binding domain-containing protein [Azospirillaceae bacterium]